MYAWSGEREDDRGANLLAKREGKVHEDIMRAWSVQQEKSELAQAIRISTVLSGHQLRPAQLQRRWRIRSLMCIK
jgi:hypothetical protein